LTEGLHNTSSNPPSQSGEPKLPFWHAPLEFLIHAFVGTLIFLIIAVFAILLERIAHKVNKDIVDIDQLIYIGLKAAEYALFLVDLLLYCVFLYRTASRTLKRL
jgi:hypothetical protein